jgi:hypothetical protein
MIEIGTLADVLYIANNLRDIEKEEIRALSGSDDYESVLRCSFNSSAVFSKITKDGNILGSGGISKFSTEVLGVENWFLWVMSTKHLNEKTGITFIKDSSRLLRIYKRVFVVKYFLWYAWAKHHSNNRFMKTFKSEIVGRLTNQYGEPIYYGRV